MSQSREPIDFQSIITRIKGLNVRSQRVLTIPVWGWTGDGKTCAILTLRHFADPVEHGVGVALVDDPTELESVVAQRPEYESLHLTELARSTVERFSTLSEAFIDGERWPPGTDIATPYLLRIRGIRQTLGFLFIPDLQGGSFRGTDGAAKSVLGDPDACAILVDPSRYSRSEVDSKRYKDAVDQQIQRCIDAGVPAAVMITKSDGAPPIELKDVDSTHVRLERIVDGAERVRIFRVSILGDKVELNDGNPPPAATRKPTELVYAWCWLLTEAVAQEEPTERTRVPPVRLNAKADAAVKNQKIPELRNLGSFSQPPGRVVGSVLGSQSSFFLLSDDGLLRLAKLLDSNDRPDASNLGQVIGLDDIDDIEAYGLGSEIILGPRRDTNALWCGRVGDALVKFGLPIQASSWTPIAADRVCIIDDSGRIHLLIRDGAKWQQSDFVADFVSAADRYLCTFMPARRALVISNGDDVAAIEVGATKFGDKVDLGRSLQFNDSELVRFSPIGLFVKHGDESGEAKLTMMKDGSPLVAEVALSDDDPFLALAPADSLVACVDSTSHVHALQISAGRLIRARNDVPLRGNITGLAWAQGARVLMVTTTENWAVYACRGFDD